MTAVATWVAVIALIIAAAALTGWLIAWRQATAMARRIADLEYQLQLQGQSISGLTAGALGVDKRLGRVEAKERVLSHRQETIENHQIPERPYQHAIRLVQHGAGVDRLVDELDLSRSEAELIVRLHGLSE